MRLVNGVFPSALRSQSRFPLVLDKSETEVAQAQASELGSLPPVWLFSASLRERRA